jgi:hypothetical protein
LPQPDPFKARPPCSTPENSASTNGYAGRPHCGFHSPEAKKGSARPGFPRGDDAEVLLLHTLGAIDATEILMIEGTRGAAQPRRRDALDAATWKRVKDAARARLYQSPRGRTSRTAAHRDLALILALGAMGLRSEEARLLTTSSIAPKRVDGLTHG